jgi:hypothetical protein
MPLEYWSKTTHDSAMQASATNRAKRQEAAASEKREQWQRDSFLIRESDQDRPEFRNRFARWLAERCTVPGVRACFDAEPGREARLAAERAWKPIAALRSRLDRAMTIRQRQALRNRIDQVIPPQTQQRISRRLDRTHQQRRGEHCDRLIKELRELTPVNQIGWLNGYLHDLRSRGIVPPSTSDITLPDTQADYYFHHKPCQWVERELKDTTFDVAFAGKVAADWARRVCEGEDLRLNELIFALVPLWPSIRAAYTKSPQKVRKFTESLLRTFLRHSASDRQMHRTISFALNTLRPAVPLGNNGDGRLAPNWNDPVAPDPQRLTSALRSFFFPELSTEELHTRRDLASKLRYYALKSDVPLLLNFLFCKGAGKRKKGLFPHWHQVLTDDSKYRHDDAMLSEYDWIEVQKYRGIPWNIIAEQLATKIAGAKPAVTESGVKARTDAFDKRLKRLPAKLQKRQAERSDKSRR